VEAKNQLEAYLYSVRSAAETLKDKLDATEHATLTRVASEGLAWLEEHQQEDKDVYEEKRKEAEGEASPIISKTYSAGPPPSGGGGGDAGPDGDGPGPTVEEVE